MGQVGGGPPLPWREPAEMVGSMRAVHPGRAATGRGGAACTGCGWSERLERREREDSCRDQSAGLTSPGSHLSAEGLPMGTFDHLYVAMGIHLAHAIRRTARGEPGSSRLDASGAELLLVPVGVGLPDDG